MQVDPNVIDSTEALTGRFITPLELHLRWKISLTAVYERKAGTNKLRRVRLGKSLRFPIEDVLKLEEELIKKATKLKKPFEDYED
jgi:hypothetical protein